VFVVLKTYKNFYRRQKFWSVCLKNRLELALSAFFRKVKTLYESFYLLFLILLFTKVKKI